MGILKPYDSIYEYRLEMLTKLNVAGTKNLYEYWSDLLYQDLTASDDRIVNLASEEYAKCIRKYVKAPVRFLTCSFKVRKNWSVQDTRHCRQDGTRSNGSLYHHKPDF